MFMRIIQVYLESFILPITEKKVMTYTMVKKMLFRFLNERHLNVVKRGYRDRGLNNKYLTQGLIPK